jgi:nucleoside-diphosphate-sugar epimerase
LLHNGYRVRAAARGPKAALLQSKYANYGSQFEAFTVSDVATEQFPQAFVGVDAVIHSASPVPQKAENNEQLLHVSEVQSIAN